MMKLRKINIIQKQEGFVESNKIVYLLDCKCYVINLQFYLNMNMESRQNDMIKIKNKAISFIILFLTKSLASVVVFAMLQINNRMSLTPH